MKVLINSGRATPFLNTRNKLLKSIVKKSDSVYITGYETGYENDLKKIGAEFVKTPVNRSGFNPLQDLRLLLTYYKIIKNEKINLVHSYTIKPNIYGSIAAKIAGVKEIYPTVNGLGYAFTGNDLRTKLTRMIISLLYFVAFGCAKKVFFQNADDAKEMVERKLIRPEKCVVIQGSGIDLEKFPKEPLPTTVSFIMVTRLLKSKGVYQYLEAAKKVKSQHKEVEFKLVGPLDPNPDGVKKEELDEFISNGIINYLGKSNQIHSLLKESSVFVLPSYYREGVPHSILEAMATGRPIITTDSPGCKETVIEGLNGYLVPTKNSHMLAEAMLKFISNTAGITKMGEESYNYATSKFEVSLVNSNMLNTMGLK